jgi:hypothetical protein
MPRIEESESEFQARIVAEAVRCGWKVRHVPDSRRTDPDWPDLDMSHRLQRRYVKREIKTANGRLSPGQKALIADLEAAGVDVGVWRPADWDSGEIARDLLGLDKRRVTAKPGALPDRMSVEEARERSDRMICDACAKKLKLVPRDPNPLRAYTHFVTVCEVCDKARGCIARECYREKKAREKKGRVAQ